ncbi:MAG: MerC domain-containing protein [Pseudomonadota bacterium]
MSRSSSTLGDRSAVMPAIDFTAIGLSSLCIFHCLGLPILAAMAPTFGAWADAEWIHQGFVFAAIPVSLFAALRMGVGHRDFGFLVLASIGLALLVSAAFLESLHDFEKPLTVAGGVLLASGHLLRWRRHRSV